MFLGPKLKIERANKHIGELQAVLDAFLKTNFYRLGIDKNPKGGQMLSHLNRLGLCHRKFP